MQQDYDTIFERELKRYSDLYASNLTQQDTALLQVSVGIFAVLATLGKDMLASSRMVGTIAITLLMLTIFGVILGYLTSNVFLAGVQKQLIDNHSNGAPLNYNFDRIKFGKFNGVLNVVTVPLFLLSLIAIFVLILFFIFGIKWS